MIIRRFFKYKNLNFYKKFLLTFIFYYVRVMCTSNLSLYMCDVLLKLFLLCFIYR